MEVFAAEYSRAVKAARVAAVDAEEEAQLTTPVSNLLRSVSEYAKIGDLRLIRETRLGRTRPDFAALLTVGGKTIQKGFVELKAPSAGVDTSAWTGRNADQWDRMKDEAEILIICNGIEAQLYRDGEKIGDPAALPYEDASIWDPDGLIKLLKRFVELNPNPVISVTDLSRRLAFRTADLRDRLLWLLEQKGVAGDAARGGYKSWQQHVYLHASQRDFADGISQVVSYGMVLAALTDNGVDADKDGHISVAEARASIRTTSPVLAAAFAPLVDKPALAEAVQVELGALETLISAIKPHRVNKSADRRGDPWLYFYEDFLAVYDPDERRQAGVYYTPVAIVQAMVAIADYLLVNRFGKRLGLGDVSVTTLDPATGTGTFPLGVIDRACTRASEERREAGPRQVAANLEKNLYAFELLPGPYSVAHLRLSQRLRQLSNGQTDSAKVVLTDTLESPLDPNDQLALFGDAEVLAAEQNRAKRIKLSQRITVAIGNPPYRRVERNIRGRGSGGWVLDGKVPGRRSKKSLFDDILDVAKEHTIFSHHASLYNLYVYFWRWSIWKAFEAHGAGPGVVALITGNSWLTGPGFVGLRQLVREICDDVWVIDLGGDNRAAAIEDNVFAIETPVSVVILVRDAESDRKNPARIHYRRVSGTTGQKLLEMEKIRDLENPLGGDWAKAPTGWRDPFVPSTGASAWKDYPRILDIFPWQQPGCKYGRTWPIAPARELLEERWETLMGAAGEERTQLFDTRTTGRKVTTKVGGLPRLSELEAGTKARPLVRYGYRSFDRQWTFADPRLAALERPSLWQSVSERQIFLAGMYTKPISAGPALTASTHVPDLDYYCGRGGKDIIALYRDADHTQPNITAGLPHAISRKLKIAEPSIEDVAAYAYAILASSAYQSRFSEELKTAGLRVPITADAKLWNETVEAGREMLWLQTYAERFRDEGKGRGTRVPNVNNLGWAEPVTVMPANRNAIRYERSTQTLFVGNGRVVGVRPDVWRYSVSRMPVLQKWLSYRTVKGAGKSASSKNELDKIRPTEWPDEWNDELLDLIRLITHTLDKEERLASLLDRILAGPLVKANELPDPKPAERKPPKAQSQPELDLG